MKQLTLQQEISNIINERKNGCTYINSSTTNTAIFYWNLDINSKLDPACFQGIWWWHEDGRHWIGGWGDGAYPNCVLPMPGAPPGKDYLNNNNRSSENPHGFFDFWFNSEASAWAIVDVNNIYVRSFAVPSHVSKKKKCRTFYNHLIFLVEWLTCSIISIVYTFNHTESKWK